MKMIGMLFGLIFGLVFAGMGTFILFETSVPTFQSWQTMQVWQPAKANIIRVNGLENDTEATYRYTVAGQDYQNDRVYVSTFKDNIGSYHQDLLNQLQDQKDNGYPVTIWYNPDKPDESVIDRNMRWGLFALTTGFGSIFIMVGLVVCYSCLTSTNKHQNKYRKPSYFELRKEWKQKKSDPTYAESFMDFIRHRQYEFKKQVETESGMNDISRSQSWLDKKEWSNNCIRSGAKKSMMGMWVFAVFWNGISTPILFVIDDEINKANYPVLVALLFPLAGLFLIRHAWRLTREWNRFGVVELEMDPFPGSIGGHMGGRIMLKNIFEYSAEYKVELECVYSYMSGSGDNRSRRENIKWAEDGAAKVESVAEGVRLKFRFDVPDNLPEADIEQKGDYYFWRFKVSANIPGVDLQRQYNIPVFNTRAESRNIRHDISAQAEKAREDQAIATQSALDQGDLDKTALAHVLRYKVRGNKMSFYYPMFRNKVLTLIALVFGGGFSFAAFSINGGFGSGGAWGIAMLIFSLPFALVGLIGTVAAIYLPLNNLSVVLAGRKIKAIRRLLFLPVKYDVVDINEIKAMEIKTSGSTGQGTSKINHYKVIVKTNNNKKITIAEDIDGKDLADQFKDFIYKKLNYSY